MDLLNNLIFVFRIVCFIYVSLTRIRIKIYIFMYTEQLTDKRTHIWN